MDTSKEFKIRELIHDYGEFIFRYIDLYNLSVGYIMNQLEYTMENNLEIDANNIFIINREILKSLNEIPLEEIKFTDEMVNLKDLVGLIYRFNSNYLTECNIEFINETEEEVVNIKQTALFEVLDEIIRNSIEHGFRDYYSSDKKIIHFTSNHKNEGIKQLIVRNTGKPIPTDIRERIFDPYYSTVALNRGQGLWNAKNILKKYGVSIELKTDNITSFVLTFMTRS